MTDTQRKIYDQMLINFGLASDPIIAAQICYYGDIAEKRFETLCFGLDETDPRFAVEAPKVAKMCLLQTLQSVQST